MIPPPDLITPKGTNITGKYRQCSECEIYITCPYSYCKKHWKQKVLRGMDECKDYKEWSSCDCNGKYNTETFKCAVCKV